MYKVYGFLGGESVEVTINNCSSAWDKFYSICEKIDKKRSGKCSITVNGEEMAVYPEIE